MEKIQAYIKQQIEPMLNNHGGSLEIVFYDKEKEKLQLRLMGQCCSCPHSVNTVENFIKTRLKENFPNLQDISVNTGVSNELLKIAEQFLRKGE